MDAVLSEKAGVLKTLAKILYIFSELIYNQDFKECSAKEKTRAKHGDQNICSAFQKPHKHSALTKAVNTNIWLWSEICSVLTLQPNNIFPTMTQNDIFSKLWPLKTAMERLGIGVMSSERDYLGCLSE